MLLRGRKRFRLYPPSAHAAMAVRGRVARVHANGRIVYEGQGDVAADGSGAGGVRPVFAAAGHLLGGRTLWRGCLQLGDARSAAQSPAPRPDLREP